VGVEDGPAAFNPHFLPLPLGIPTPMCFEGRYLLLNRLKAGRDLSSTLYKNNDPNPFERPDVQLF
jgi:hypothetical protein